MNKGLRRWSGGETATVRYISHVDVESFLFKVMMHKYYNGTMVLIC